MTKWFFRLGRLFAGISPTLMAIGVFFGKDPLFWAGAALVPVALAILLISAVIYYEAGE